MEFLSRRVMVAGLIVSAGVSAAPESVFLSYSKQCCSSDSMRSASAVMHVDPREQHPCLQSVRNGELVVLPGSVFERLLPWHQADVRSALAL
ncbi:hypothetical protein HaLaN_26744, partial [Haematococcus lacustris]